MKALYNSFSVYFVPLLAVNLVEVVLLRDDVQDLGRVFAVVGGVPLADVLNPEQMSQ